MVWIPYGDSGSLTNRFDSDSFSFGSVIYFDAQSKTAAYTLLDSAATSSGSAIVYNFDDDILVRSDSNDHDVLTDTYSISVSQTTGNIDAEKIVTPSKLFKDSSLDAVDTFIKDEPDEGIGEASGPTQVWIG